MNYENIKKYIKECFLSDGIQRKDVYTDVYEVVTVYNEKYLEYHVKDSFRDYIFHICTDGSFFEFCCDQTENCIGEALESIQEKIIHSDEPMEYEDLDNVEFIYNWYLTDRIKSCLKDGFHFFIDILDDIEQLHL